MAARILVVDDDDATVEFVTIGLQHEGHETTVASTGREALDAFKALTPDLVVLDLMLPDLDGLEVCRTLRAASQVPILMLTARGDTMDKVAGLDSGADDYLAKPFRLPELQARVRALLRRSAPAASGVIVHGPVRLDAASRQCTVDGRFVELTRREFDLLELLMRNPQQVFNRDQILSQVWGWEFAGDTNVVDVTVSALRARVGPSGRTLIRTVRGIGYGLGPLSENP